MLEEPYYLV